MKRLLTLICILAFAIALPSGADADNHSDEAKNMQSEKAKTDSDGKAEEQPASSDDAECD